MNSSNPQPTSLHQQTNILLSFISIPQIVKLLYESNDILKIEPIGSPEYSMSLAAQDALKKMGNI